MCAQKIDQELVLQAQQGDRAAFDLLVLKYQHRVAKIARRYLSDPHEIMDVTQETFIKAFRAINKFRNESGFYTWLYRIAINTSKNHFVANKKQAQISGLNLDEIEKIAEPMSLREEGTPEHFLLHDEMEAVVLSTLDNLPKDLKTALILREMEGFSYEEIAAAVGCPVGTVRSRLFRAREVIDAKVKPFLGGHT